jgi:formylglycine-generating enzyme required for sulfatase activity/serine/threonine protein kinase
MVISAATSPPAGSLEREPGLLEPPRGAPVRFATVGAERVSAGAGSIVGGKYRLVREIGRGGMGVVWEAVHAETHRKVAVKLVHVHLATNAALVDKLLREASITSSIEDRSHIVDVRDAGRDGELGVPYLVMELLSGKTLAEHVEQEGPLPAELVGELIHQLGEALDEAHRAGVVHRDLKPSNVMLTYRKGDPVLKVLDFGIAKALGDAGGPQTATHAATLAYGAPEQLGASLREQAAKAGIQVAAGVSPQTDVWAMGLFAYELFTGYGPDQLWDAQSPADLVFALLRPVPSARERAGKRAGLLPPGFDGWLSRCLEKDATRRWPTAGEAARALAALTQPKASAPASRPVVETRVAFETFAPGVRAPEGPSAPPPPPAREPEVVPIRVRQPDPERPMSPARRGVSAGAVLTGGVVAVLVGLAGWGVWSSQKSPGVPLAETPSSTPVLPSAASPVAAPPQAPPAEDPSCPRGMARIEGGRFKMGSEDGHADERPAHEVNVETFCLDRTEVTVEAYEACVTAAGCTQADTGLRCNAGSDRKQHPINCVDWDQATAFCDWKEKGQIRLPTEAEWEYAARGGSERRKYPWGDEEPSPKLLNMWGDEDGFAATAPVGSFADEAKGGKRARWNLLDMAGNVYEWTSSLYCPYPNKPDGSNECASESRVYRGGGWVVNVASRVRGAGRDGLAPSNRDYNLGFRCARAPLP